MAVTKRFVLLVAAGAVLLMLAALFGAFLWLFLMYNAICFGLLILDVWHTPSAKGLVVTRLGEDKLYYKTENIRAVNVRNMTERPLFTTVREDLPDWHFDRARDAAGRLVPPHGEEVFEYAVVPTKRGSFPFCHIHAKVRGPFGLCHRYHKYSLPVDMKVYPNLRDLGKYRLIMRKDRLLSAGGRRIRERGVGLEFESLRDYVEGDDYRKINWNNTARNHKLIVNQYEAEKNQPVFLLIDTGRTMSYTSRGYKKLDLSINAALVLADIVNLKGDNSGLLVFDTEPRALIMPGKGESHRNNLMKTLYHTEDSKNASDYEGAFIELIAKQKRRCLAFIFTDFDSFEDAEALLESVQVLKKRHVPIVVLMKNEGVAAMAENPGSSLETVFEKAAAMDFLRERKRVINTLNAMGVFCVESEAERFALTAVNHYLRLKS